MDGAVMSLERFEDGWRMRCFQCDAVLERRNIESPVGEAAGLGWEIIRDPEIANLVWACPECARAARETSPDLKAPTAIPNEPDVKPAAKKAKKEKLRSPPKDWRRPIYSRDWTKR
jgi:hypothetical protein